MEDCVDFVGVGEEGRERSGEEVEGGDDDEKGSGGEGWESGEVEEGGGGGEGEGDLFVRFSELWGELVSGCGEGRENARRCIR